MALPSATLEGTAAYAQRFQGTFPEGAFRAGPGGFSVSSIGLGTYLGKEDEATDVRYQEAVVAAVEGGVNVLDTAINYREQRSEQAIGRALLELQRRGFPREGIVVATKGGYVPSRDPEGYFEEHLEKKGLAKREDLVAGCHSMAKGYLRHQMARSLENLAVQSLDLYYLHNPEQQLDEVGRIVFMSRVRDAFEVLEEAASQGKISCYGAATWSGFRVATTQEEGLSLEDLVSCAISVAGGGHHFRVVQLPFNLAMTEAMTKRTQVVKGKEMTLLQAAHELDVRVMASASLLQGRLSRGLPEGLKEHLGTSETDAQRAIQFARSGIPSLTTALVGMERVEHVRENIAVLRREPIPEETMGRLLGRG